MRVLMSMRGMFARVACGGGAALALAMMAGVLPAAHAATLDPSVLPNVKAATFEVVAAKPTHDPLSYAEPLPRNLIPYQRRTDKYYSIGTAFCIGPNRYVTAGHVLLTGLDSLWGPLALRDAGGHVYAIDQIEKFSLRRDFVVFSLKDPPPHAAQLAIDTDPEPNQRVYAVGNALGTGVVIRGGLYTSDTPEDQDGEWKWIRFSAAASPGNSGGPLLDQSGKVIGVVLMKSPDENLNYALPIRQVLDAPDNTAVIDHRISYQFDLIPDTRTGTFKARFTLPMSEADFFAKFLDLRHAFVDGQLKALLDANADTMFPHGKGSARLLYGSQANSTFPLFLTRSRSGHWALSSNRDNVSRLDDNGFISTGHVGTNILFHIRKPDTLSAAKLYGDPGELMDLMAKAGFLVRPMAGTKDQITSLGQPTVDTSHVDAWQRRWRIRVWPIPYSDHIVIVFTLPVPNGVVGFLRWAPVAREHDFRINMLAMTDYFQAAYRGTLQQWQAFLERKQWLPRLFDQVHLDIAYGDHFGYRSSRLAFTVPSSLQKVAAKNVLTLWPSFYRDGGKVVWDVSNVVLSPGQHDNGAVLVVRHPDADGDPDQGYQHQWDEIVHRQPPYDAVVRHDGDVTKITGVAGHAGDKNPAMLYSVNFLIEGKHSQKFMQARLDTLLDGMHVYEQ